MAMIKDLLQGRPMGHALHPFLVHVPIGLFVLSFGLDLASQFFPRWSGLVPGAFYAMFLGVVTGVVAAVPGFVDFADIRRDHPARRVALAHMALNLVAIGLYAVNLGARTAAFEASRTPLGPFFTSLAGLMILGISGYLGGHLVYSEGIGVGRHRRAAPTVSATLELHTAGPAAEAWPRTPTGLLVPIPGAERLRDAERLRLSIDGQVVVLFKHEGRFSACQEFCTHRFGPLSEGELCEGQVVCPWHRSRFELRDGTVAHGPARESLRMWNVVQHDGQICVADPLPSGQTRKG